MFSHIKTSKANKEVVTQLTNKLNLGAENVIARIALAYSLSKEEKLSLDDIQDSGGKEYSKAVIFGENFSIYQGLVCAKYDISIWDERISKFIKIHIDSGLIELARNYQEFNFIEIINHTIFNQNTTNESLEKNS